MNGYKPLPDYLELKESEIHGIGLHANEHIEAGTTLGISHYDVKGLTNEHMFNRMMIRTPIGGWINHSKGPNCIFREVGRTWWLDTYREVQEGEELTVDYSLYRCGTEDVCADDI